MFNRYIFSAILLVFSFNFTRAQTAHHWETAVFNNDTWRYFVGTSEPDIYWRNTDFDDSNWKSGIGGFGFGDGDDNTIISQCTSVYIRIKFNVTDTTSIATVLLNMDYDDAFVAYLNNSEIARVGITGVHPAYNVSGNDHEAQMYKGNLPESFLINKSKLSLCLKQGMNVLTVQVHNSTATSSDMSSNVFLSFLINNSTTYFRSVPNWFKAPFVFTSSNLPIITIKTQPGVNIIDEPKVAATMTVYNNGIRNNLSNQVPEYKGNIGIEIRGSYSQTFPQKSYGIETRDSLGENMNVRLLGMPKENDWVLLANYNDKALMRNSLAFDLFREMGHYAPRIKHCEVVVNDDYLGIFHFGEKIKQDKNRVNIASIEPTDSTGDKVTGGYIFKTDYTDATNNWLSSFSPINKAGAKVYFVYHDPKPEDITAPQKKYLKEYINALETVLYSNNFNNPSTGYRAYLDEASFIDYFIIGEITRNPDTYKKSRYFYKDRDSLDRKVYSGPVWDYDWAYKNINNTCVNENQTDGSGWSYMVNECNPRPVPPSWEVKMLQDTVFANAINSRYFQLRKTIMSNTKIDQYIDSIAAVVDEAQQRHYTKWPTLGINVGTPELDAQPTTYSGEITKFKNWLHTRLGWLDANMVGRKSVNTAIETPKSAIFRIFPNPVASTLYIESDKKIQSIDLMNIGGQTISHLQNIGTSYTSIELVRLTKGDYLVMVKLVNGESITQKVIKQ
ncbi:MAG TPA: CotH kinase family protein [Paludibacter sp.]